MSMFFTLAETIHGKYGHALFVATPLPKFGKDEFRKLLVLATETNGYYSDLRGGDKIPGFQFKTSQDRNNFLARAKSLALASVPPAWTSPPTASYVDGKFHMIEIPVVSRHKGLRHPSH